MNEVEAEKNRGNYECCSILWNYLIQFPCSADGEVGTQTAKGTCPKWHISTMSKSPGPYSDTFHLALEWLGCSPSQPQPSSILDFSKNLENKRAVLLILVYLHMWVCALVLRIEGDVKIALSAALSEQKVKRKWKGCLQRGCHVTRFQFWSHQKAVVLAERSCFLKRISYSPV